MAELTDSRESQDVSDQVGGRYGKTCQPCNRRNKVQTATMFCKDCKQYQCDECIKTHEMFDALSGHEIVKAEEASTLKPVFDMKGLDKCKDHSEPLKYFCIDEQKLCCTTCAITNHRGCTEVQEVLAEARKPSFNTSDVESAIRELQDTAANIGKLLQEITSSTASKLEAALDYIDAIKSTLLSKFDELKVALTEQFKSMEGDLLKNINENTERIKNICRELFEKEEYLGKAKTCGTPDQLFIATQVIENNISPYKTTLADQQASLYSIDCSVDCGENMQQLLMSSVNLATFDIKKIPIDPSEAKLGNPVQLKLINSIDLKQGKDETKVPFYTGIDFLPDGRLVLVDNSNKLLVIMNQNLVKKGIHMFNYFPKDVCVVSKEEVAVTSGGNYLIEFLQVSKTNAITSTRTVKTTTQYHSICLMNEKTFLVSTFDDSRPLRMVTLTGQEKDFDNLERKVYKFNASGSTLIGNKGIAVLTDRYQNTVYMYDVVDKGVTRYVLKLDDFKQPRGICVGPNNSVFVCNNDADSIVRVSSCGKVVATHNLDMKFPRAVGMSKDGKRLAVSNSAVDKRILQLFIIYTSD